MDSSVTMDTEAAMKVESGEKDLNYLDEYMGKLRDESHYNSDRSFRTASIDPASTIEPSALLLDTKPPIKTVIVIILIYCNT